MASVEPALRSERPASRRPPRLLLRFAAYAGIVLAAVGVGIAVLADRQIGSRAEETVAARAETVTADTLRRSLRARDFERPVSRTRRAELDALVRTRVVLPGVVAVRLVNRRGVVTYAGLHRVIGTRASYPSGLATAFDGRPVRRTTHTKTLQDRRDVKVLQALIPVMTGASAGVVGVVEIDQDYRAVDLTTSEARERLVAVLGIGLLALYIAFFPLLRRATSELESRNRRLHAEAAEREELLEAERSARSEAESIQRLLTEQNDRLRDLDRMKDEFVSLVSHQLRTPLTSIRGYVELMLEDDHDLTPEQLRFLSVVDRNAHRLLDLVSDLLFLAQVDAGRLEIEHAQVDFARLVRDCVETTRPIAASRGVSLESAIHAVPPLVGDPSRLAQLLDNLVVNAIKFTPAGGRVAVRLEAAVGRVVLTVEDTGLGMSPSDLGKVFDRFYRGSRATANAVPGSGLGLPIAKAIVDRHGGRISIESREDEGTVVRLELPLETPVPEPAQVAAPASRVR